MKGVGGSGGVWREKDDGGGGGEISINILSGNVSYCFIPTPFIFIRRNTPIDR